jgi:hypothetical protein
MITNTPREEEYVVGFQSSRSMHGEIHWIGDPAGLKMNLQWITDPQINESGW